MEVRRIAEYKNPSYPDSSAVGTNPALLMALPERWKHNAAVCAAVAATSAILLSACDTAAVTPAGQNASAVQSPSPTPTAPAAIAVPFFEHGGGRGGFGCDSVAPPAFLSEAEAFDVISEIASSEGLVFQRNSTQLENVDLPLTTIVPSESGKSVLGAKKGHLVLDGSTADGKVAFEFVSEDDVNCWKKNPGEYALIYSFDFLNTARALSNSLQKANPGTAAAVFYDPNYDFESAAAQQIIDDSSIDSTAKERKLKDLAKEDLRAQVRDFIAWLKAQEII